MENVINLQRVRSVFALLWLEWRDGSFPYLSESMARVPHRMLEPAMTHEWSATEVFFATHLLRGKIQSHIAMNHAVRLLTQSPELFDPEQAVHLTSDDIHERLEDVFGTIPKGQRYAEAWWRNAHILMAWGGDILAVYEGVVTEAEMRARIVNKLRYDVSLVEQGFYGFQAKMASLLTINLMRGEFIEPIRVSFPVDFHHMRAMIGTGMIKLPNGSYDPDVISALGDKIGRWYLDEHHEVDPVHFSELLFVLSREGCVRAITDPAADWDDPAVQQQYQLGCGRCPVEHLCRKSVVHSDYYIRDGSTRRRSITVIDRPQPPRRIRIQPA